MPDLPTGVVTFLFTDVEGALQLLDRAPEKTGRALRRHLELLRRVIEAHSGFVFSSAGDCCLAAFATAADGVAAALEAQRAQLREPHVENGPLRVRMALHTGDATPLDGDYLCPALNLTSRLSRLADGGQVLLSQATCELVRDGLPPGTHVRDLGEHYLGDPRSPTQVFQLLASDLADNSAPDRVLVTILFTDIVNSTATAADLGDRRWRSLLGRHHALVRDQLVRFRGREVRTTGDGMFAAFDTPTRAVECARAVEQGVRRLGLKVKAGIHTGECELVGNGLEGIAVHVAARVAEVAAGCEILVSATVKDLVAGSGIEFADRGTYVLKGVPGELRLFSVVEVDDVFREPIRKPVPSAYYKG